MPITQYLKAHGFHTFEGFSQQVPRQVADLVKLSSSPNISVLEIGFNAGHSAEIFLNNNPTLTLTSFDLGCHDYVLAAKKYIDKMYPNRHTLILGDSTVTVPLFINDNPGKNFDLIFIDGGHEYAVAAADLVNCGKLAHKDTIVAIDDTIYTPGWEKGYTIGPTKVWTEHIRDGKIIESNRIDYQLGRGMSWGKYIL